MYSTVFAVSLLVWAAVPASASVQGRIDRTLPVTGEVELEVMSNHPGGMTITAGSAGTVQVRAVIKPVLGAADLGLTTANIRALEKNPPIEQAGNHVRIGYVTDPAILKGVSIQFDIQVPRESRLRTHASSGGIRIDGVAGPAFADTSSGRIEITDVAKDVDAKTSSGAVLIRNSGGRVMARTSSGGIHVSNVHGPVDVETTSGRTDVVEVHGDVHSRTQSGSVHIENATGMVVANNHSGSIDALRLDGPVHAGTRSGAIRISQLSAAAITARTESGAINVNLAAGKGYQIDAQSDSGRVSGRVSGGVGSVATAHQLKGQLGEGGPLVDLDTRSSKITVN